MNRMLKNEYCAINVLLFINLIKFFLLINEIQCVQRSTSSTSTLTTSISTIKCSVLMEPNYSILKQNGDSENFDQQFVAKCSAHMNGESFTHPAFDLSFGDTTNNGLYIIRGLPKCQENRTKCESLFKINSLALKKLLLPSSEENDAINEKSTTTGRMNHPSIIKVTCEVVDTASHSKLPVRCTDSGIVEFAKKLQFGQSCSGNVTNEECGTNMRCITKNGISICQCKRSAIEIRDNMGKIVCLESANLGEKCFVNKQCAVVDANSMCVHHLAEYRTCQCAKDYQLATIGKKNLCEPIKSIPESSPITIIDESTFKQRQLFNDQLNGTDSSSGKTSQFSQLGLAIGLLIMVWLLIVAVILVRYFKEKRKMANIDSISKKKCNDTLKNNHRSNNNKAIFGLAYKSQSNDNDIDVKIFEDEIDEAIRTIRQTSTSNLSYISDNDNRLNPMPNFDIFAKQSMV